MKFNLEPKFDRVERNYSRDRVSFQKEIDGFVYNFSLNQVDKEKGIWSLDFIVNDSESLINQGLGVFNKAVEVMYEFVKDTMNKKDIRILRIEASKENNDDARLKTVLADIFLKNPEIFKGFNYSKIEDVYVFGSKPSGIKKTICWVDSENTISAYVEHDMRKGLQNLTDRTIRRYIVDKMPIGDFVSKDINVAIIRRGDLQEVLPELMSYLKLDFKEEDISKKKDSQTQRMNLYERALKTKFPPGIFSRKGNVIEIDMNVSKKLF